MRTWLSAQLETGPIEVGIAGDLDVEATIALAARTLGTLPYRFDRSTLRPRAVRPPLKSETVESIITSRNPKATVWMAWIIPGVENALMARRLAALVRQIAADLVKGGVTEDEFQRARQPILAGLEQHLRDNGYWLYYVLARAQEQPVRLDWPRTRNRDFEAMTRDDVSVMARECLNPNRTFSCLVEPKP